VPIVEGGAARRQLAPVLVLVLGLVITGILTWTCWTVNDHNEVRLLRLQVKEVGTVLGAALPNVESPLTSAADIVRATNGNAARFEAYVAPYAGPNGPFRSVALYKIGGATTIQLVIATGKWPAPAPGAPSLRAALDRAAATHTLDVTGQFSPPDPGIAYALSVGSGPQFVVYAETAVHPRQPLKVARNSAFADLNYALYLGRSARTGALLGATNISRLPLTGRTASVTTPFGNNYLYFVATPAGELGGSLLNRLPWIVAGLGTLFTVVAAVAAEQLVRGRRLAEQLAIENQALYGEQRTIARTLQRSLLPEQFPDVPGLEFAGRYLPGTERVDVGGDWYDVIGVGTDNGFLFVVGDVSGRGIEAATTMACLHYAIRAYAAQGDPPPAILSKLSGLLRVSTDGQFATVLCGAVDVYRHEVTLASAGHLPPLLLTSNHCEYIETFPGAPIGVSNGHPKYKQVTFSVPRQATLLAFTDGLVERRGETLDVGLERLRTASSSGELCPLDNLLTKVVTSVMPGTAQDDTAILGLRWTS
jgi:serine phosphatase RsbU (regulator of sigma subunit)